MSATKNRFRTAHGAHRPRESLATNSKEHFAYLDGWRGLAITFLLIGHFFPVPGINLGHVGVNLFFVLSGLLMGRLLFIKRTPLAIFYRRRISRIVPAHVTFVLVIVASFALMGKPIAVDETVAALVFVINYLTAVRQMPFGHVWSLAVEEHAYILLSILALVHRKRQATLGPILALSAGACVVAAWRYSNGAYALQYRTEVAAYGILTSALFLILLNGRARTLPSSIYPILLSVAVALHWWRLPLYVSQAFGVGLLAVTVNLLATAPAWVQRLLSVRLLTQLGTWSFSIYLWQQPFYLMAAEDYLSAPIAASLAIAFGVVSFYVIERPARAWLNRL